MSIRSLQFHYKVKVSLQVQSAYVGGVVGIMELRRLRFVKEIGLFMKRYTK